MMRMDKAMTLLYLDQQLAGDAYTADKVTNGSNINLAKHYIPITQIPLIEFMHYRNPTQLVEEVITITLGADWRRKERRPIYSGDIICRGLDPWVVLKLSDIQPGKRDNAIIPLQLWPNYGIYFLPGLAANIKELMR